MITVIQNIVYPVLKKTLITALPEFVVLVTGIRYLCIPFVPILLSYLSFDSEWYSGTPVSDQNTGIPV